jgi:FxLD family lantipeptide
MSRSPLMTMDVMADIADAEIGEDEFELDLHVVEAAYPIAKLMCDTSDQCGSTCSGSACNSSANAPY